MSTKLVGVSILHIPRFGPLVLQLFWSDDWRGVSPWADGGRALPYFSATREARGGEVLVTITAGPVAMLIAWSTTGHN